MTEQKRFTITQDFEEHHRQIRDNGHIIMGCFIEEQAKVIVDLLNELNDENEELKKENKRLKEILKIKRKEIINRVLALQEITDKYTNEVLFKNNVNPNDAVKQVLKEILSSKVIDDD